MRSRWQRLEPWLRRKGLRGTSGNTQYGRRDENSFLPGLLIWGIEDFWGAGPVVFPRLYRKRDSCVAP